MKQLLPAVLACLLACTYSSAQDAVAFDDLHPRLQQEAGEFAASVKLVGDDYWMAVDHDALGNSLERLKERFSQDRWNQRVFSAPFYVNLRTHEVTKSVDEVADAIRLERVAATRPDAEFFSREVMQVVAADSGCLVNRPRGSDDPEFVFYPNGLPAGMTDASRIAEFVVRGGSYEYTSTFGAIRTVPRYAVWTPTPEEIAAITVANEPAKTAELVEWMHGHGISAAPSLRMSADVIETPKVSVTKRSSGGFSTSRQSAGARGKVEFRVSAGLARLRFIRGRGFDGRSPNPATTGLQGHIDQFGEKYVFTPPRQVTR